MTSHDLDPATEMEAAAPPAKNPASLSPSQLGEVMRLVKDVDSVELKLTVPANAHRTTIRGLGIDPVEAEPRQVFFYDTRQLTLNKAGIVVRARRFAGGAGDTVVKLRPVVPDELPDDLRRSASCKVELDALPGGFVVSASVKGRCTGDEVNEIVEGARKLRKVLTKDQRAFYRAHAPKNVDLDALVPLGPTFVLRSQLFVKRLDRKVTAEVWLYPDGSRVLELSTKAEPREAFEVAVEFRSYLESRGVHADGEQQTKTKTALDFFAGQLQPSPNGRKRGR
jgi:hypothetical protein